MSKKLLSLMLVMISAFSVVGLAACAGTEDTGGASVIIRYWGSGGTEENEVFTELVQNFNSNHRGDIFVKYEHKPSVDGLAVSLNGRSGPDVFYMDERTFKQYATEGYLLELTEYYNNSTVLTKEIKDDAYPYTFDRYRYNVTTTTQTESDPLWAYPKDLAPTIIYYNKKHFDNAGITIVSEDEANINAYNQQNPSAKKSIKAFYTKDGTKYFNNRIAMSWEEARELSAVLMDGGAKYGFYTEWWFNYLWSVGGDCIGYVKTGDAAYNGGYYEMTFSDATKNYIVKDDQTEELIVNGTTYQAGEIISYNDKKSLTAEDKAKCNELPSSREAFTEFLRYAQREPAYKVVDTLPAEIDPNSFYGANGQRVLESYNLSPPSAAVTERNAYFRAGNIGMVVSTSSAIKYNETITEFEWDIAPMLQYKEYSQDGTEVLVHGTKAAHSGSVAIGVNKKTQNADAAVKFAEYIASPEAQMIQAGYGFAVPYYTQYAQSEEYMSLSILPGNASILAEACAIGKHGDWNYLLNKKWIDDWANYLNGTVRNGKATLDKFLNDWMDRTNNLLKEYTKK